MPDSGTEPNLKSIPPYVAYKTFENFIDTLRAGVIPSRIDRGVMHTMSGGVQSHLMSALRYLEFVNSAAQPTERMKAFVHSEGSERKNQLAEMIRYAYPFLFHDFDLANVTPQHLEEQFQANTSAHGATLKKCVVFFLAVSKAAGSELSPLLKRTRSPRGNGQRRKAAASGTLAASQKHEEHEGDRPPSSWSKALLDKFPAFDPNWTEEVQAKWFAAFERLMGAKEND